MTIDIHCHTSLHPMHGLHTVSATIDSLEELADRYQIDLFILLATYFPLKGTGVGNREMLRRAAGRPRFKVFGSLDVLNNLTDGLAELTLLASENVIAGIKLYPGYQLFSPDEVRLHPIYELAQQYNLPVMLHGGQLHVDRKFRRFQLMAHPTHAQKVASRYSTLKIVVSHLANPYFSSLRRVMSACPNVFTDFSGQLTSGSTEDTEIYRQKIATELKRFIALPRGSDRLLFGTDFPIQSHQSSFDLLDRLDLNPLERAKVLHHNAAFILDPNQKLEEKHRG